MKQWMAAPAPPSALSKTLKNLPAQVTEVREMREKLLWLAIAAALVAPGAQAQSGKVKTVSLPDAQISLVQGANGGYLGVYLADVKSEERAKELKLAEVRGAVVGKVVGGSPAAKAGLKENDVILKFDDEVIRSAAHVHRLLVETPPGRNVALRVSRNGAEQTVNVTLGERSFEHIGQGILRPEAGTLPGEVGKERDKIFEDFGGRRPNFIPPGHFYDPDASRYRLGVRVAPLSEQLANYFGVKGEGGLLVTEVEAGGLAERAGLKAGDCITAVNGERVTTASELSGAMRRAGKAAAKEQGTESGPVTLTVVRDRKEQAIQVKPEERKS
jgi:serine protease Do